MTPQMIGRIAVSGFLLLGAFATAAAESLTVKGTNPGGRGDYEGTATVTEATVTGTNNRVFNVVWKIGKVETDGIGMTMAGNSNALYVGYKADDGAGIAMIMHNADGTINVQWLSPGIGKVGKEVWTPVK